MPIIILFSVLTLLWPIGMIITVGKKHIIKYIIGTFIVFFVGINSVHSFYSSLTTVRVLMSIFIIISIIPMIYFGYKRKCWTKENLKESFGWLWSLYLIIAIAMVIRLFINHMNSDTLAYARNAIYIREGTLSQHDLPLWYKTPTFYHAAALVKHPADFFTIYGEVLQVTLFSIALNVIIRNIKNKNIIFIVIVSALVAVGSIYALSYKTSGVNWSAVAISLLFILAARKSIITLLLIPFSMSIFSFSPMLVLPLSIVFIIMMKKWTLKDVVMIVSITLSTLVFMGMSLFNLSYKLFAAIPVLLIINIGLYYEKWIPEKEFANKIYSIKIKKIMDLQQKKYYKPTFYVIAVGLFIFAELIMTLMILDVIYFPLIVGANEKALMWTIPIAVFLLGIDAIKNNKISYQLWWMISLVVIMMGYAVLQMIPGVANYTVDRISLPFSMCIILVALLRVVEIEYKTKQGIILGSMATVSISICNLGLMASGFMPSTIYSPISTSIEMNYKFVTSQEQKVAVDNMKKDDVVYSDIALSSIRSIWDEHAFFTNQMRTMYFSEMRDRMNGIPTKYWEMMAQYRVKYQMNPKYWDSKNNKLTKEGQKEFDKDVKDKKMVKKAVEFSGLSDSIDILNSNKAWWTKWDSLYVNNTGKNAKNITVFMFRRKKYADMVSKHYSKTISNSDGLYIVRI